MPPNYITQEYFDKKIDELRAHVVSRIDKMETTISVEHRRDIDRVERSSNLKDVGVLIGTIIAATLGVLGLRQ